MGDETVAVYDPHLADSIPAWVVENIQAVSAYMKNRGHEDWTIAGVRSQAAHAREVEMKGEYIRGADSRISVLASLLNQANVDRLREVERAVANERVRDVHTCHDQCTKTELCRMTRRAEAAEALVARWREAAGRIGNEVA